MKKFLLIGLLALLFLASIVMVVTMEHWIGNVDTAAAIFLGSNGRLTKAVISLVVFVILGLFGVVYKGPKR